MHSPLNSINQPPTIGDCEEAKNTKNESSNVADDDDDEGEKQIQPDWQWLLTSPSDPSGGIFKASMAVGFLFVFFFFY